MTKKQILKLIKWNPKTKTLSIGSYQLDEALDISIEVINDIKGNVDMENIGGNNIQKNIGGKNNQANIRGLNNQFNIFGNNTQRHIKGNNRQWNIEGRNSQWDVDGDNTQGNIGGNNKQLNVKGDSYNSKHYVRNGVSTLKVNYTDGILMHSIKKKPLKNGIEYIEGTSINRCKTWLVKNNFINYHSLVGLENAKKGFQKKLEAFREGIGKWVKTLKDDSMITDEIFHEKTGSCYPGIEAWKTKAGISELKEITFKELKELFVKYPTSETKKIVDTLEYIKNEKGDKNV